MLDKSIGLEENDYPVEEAIKEYQELIGLPENYLNDLAEKEPEPLEPMEPQPQLPYNTENFELKVTTNEQGEYIFVQGMRFYFFISPVYRDFLSELSYKILKEDLTRSSFERQQIALKNFHSEDAQQMKIAKEVASILEILERTIEMEYDFTATDNN
ncbi:hypothetical protein [Lysinibacillus sp. SGAir0095]|uniref:hypothetical protein n=1 Tax=Lysinibacillus sp. SGAir0095 TaxID=2070463 RepID=UPI0010CCF0A5|nr:hypothetical protein [Lysinibacillus sp. SGAir0095]QCR34276.1 hypothetical protein C1N55_20085 [Lysinibacillus sp. SGAir0095]